MKTKHYGEYAFLAGIALVLLLSLLTSFIPDDAKPILVAVLAILGIVVGLSNIEERDIPTFLIAAIAIIVAATSWTPIISVLGLLGEVGLGSLGEAIANVISTLITMLIAFISPAAFVVAVKRIYHLAKM